MHTEIKGLVLAMRSAVLYSSCWLYPQASYLIAAGPSSCGRLGRGDSAGAWITSGRSCSADNRRVLQLDSRCHYGYIRASEGF